MSRLQLHNGQKAEKIPKKRPPIGTKDSTEQRKSLNEYEARALTGRQIVLVSGGIESSTLLRQVHATHGGMTLPLFIDYAQRAVEQERMACRAQWKGLGLTDVVEADIGTLGRGLRKRQKERQHIPLHHRNAVLLAVAASVAAQEGATGVWIAICKDDLSWYPSASIPFLKAMGSVLHLLDPQLRLHTPLTELSKADVVHVGFKLGVQFDNTWSCMLDRETHCGRCIQCRSRKAAFAACGVTEVDGFYSH